jgi:hypothetical protein
MEEDSDGEDMEDELDQEEAEILRRLEVMRQGKPGRAAGRNVGGHAGETEEGGGAASAVEGGGGGTRRSSRKRLRAFSTDDDEEEDDEEKEQG